MIIRYKAKDNQAKIYRPKEARLKKEFLTGIHMENPRKESKDLLGKKGGGRKEGLGDGNMRCQEDSFGGGTESNNNEIDTFISGTIMT